ncbi:hypothetical protein [Allomesorhizobium camelthorni]|uniref:Uncharacterized protein n=1 Tax=Allomesorhizobium camelthorni TaxID=475069 RepID=A0A6G4W828_9HYPH|nr:hypothetical protein [Mesorhizobium camelthorni]NGO50478.1 hypothetical protein [Mesorhizobium camelthorni]
MTEAAKQDLTCTDCGGTGETYQTEKRCACQPYGSDIADLVDELRAGVAVCGETSSGAELYDIDAAETTMAKAADAVTAASLEAEKWKQRWQAKADAFEVQEQTIAVLHHQKEVAAAALREKQAELDTWRDHCHDWIARFEKVESALRAQEAVTRAFTNELGNRIKITIEGPTSTSENILTPVEYAELQAACAQPAAVADQIIGQIEERFPNWRSYRDLIDCIDCTLHDLRDSAGLSPSALTVAAEEARNELARRRDAGWDARVPLTGPKHLERLSDSELSALASPQPAASGWGSLKEGDRVSCTDYGVIDSIDEEGTAAVVWEASGCVGDVDLDRLVPASPPAPQHVQAAREGVLTDRQWMLLKKAADEGGIYPQPALPDHPGSWDGDVCALSEMGLLDTSQEIPHAPGRPRNVPGPKDGPRTAWHVLTEKGRAALSEARPS